MPTSRFWFVLIPACLLPACDSPLFRSLQRIEPPTDTFGCGPNAGAQELSTTAQASGITLTWVSDAVNEDGFVVERSDGGPWHEVGRTGVNATSFHDDSVLADTAYTYRVRSFRVLDAQDCVSTPTPEAAQLSAPAPITDLTGTGTSTTTIELTWLDPNVHPTVEYRVRRSVAGQGAIPVGTSTQPHFLDTALSATITFPAPATSRPTNATPLSGGRCPG